MAEGRGPADKGVAMIDLPTYVTWDKLLNLNLTSFLIS